MLVSDKDIALLGKSFEPIRTRLFVRLPYPPLGLLRRRLPDYEVFMDQRAHDAMEDFGGPEWAIEDEADQLKKYILVVRDPRDATVSLMHYHHEGADNEKLQEDTRKYIKHYVTWLGFWCGGRVAPPADSPWSRGWMTTALIGLFAHVPALATVAGTGTRRGMSLRCTRR